jgi:hypothetical protein
MMPAVACAATLLAGVTAVASAAGGGSQLSVSINRAAPGRTVPAGFVGLGMEFKTVPGYIGSRPINGVLVQLVHNLDPGQQPFLRIGGLSTDHTWWPVHGIARSPGITYTLSSSWAAAAKALVQAIDARAILGVNLEANKPVIAATETSHLRGPLGSHLSAVEIGNEPELYDRMPWYFVSHGHPYPWYDHVGQPVYSRPAGYSFGEVINQFAGIRKALPRVPVAGPAIGNVSWLAQLPGFIAANPGLRWITFHRYGLNKCVKDPANPDYPSVPHLLSTNASRGLMQGIAPSIALAHRHHIGFLIDETGTVTCNGKAGVSNSFASALWGVDSMFEMVSQGVDGASFHTFPHNPNALFDFAQSNGKWTGFVHPVYYGLLMFAQAAPPGARLLPVSGTAGSDLRAWATLAGNHTLRVALINESLTRAYTVAVGGTGSSSGTATLQRLQAHSAYSTSGVMLGGQGFGSRTSTGMLAGQPQSIPVRPGGGRYTVDVPASSAALLTVTSS